MTILTKYFIFRTCRWRVSLIYIPPIRDGMVIREWAMGRFRW